MNVTRYSPGSLKFKSLKGTPDENKHCGLGLSDVDYQALQALLLGGET